MYEPLTPVLKEQSNIRTVYKAHPYVFLPPTEQKRFYKEGEGFSFSLLLFGEYIQYLPHILYACQQMGERGVGKRV